MKKSWSWSQKGLEILIQFWFDIYKRLKIVSAFFLSCRWSSWYAVVLLDASFHPPASLQRSQRRWAGTALAHDLPLHTWSVRCWRAVAQYLVSRPLVARLPPSRPRKLLVKYWPAVSKTTGLQRQDRRHLTPAQPPWVRTNWRAPCYPSPAAKSSRLVPDLCRIQAPRFKPFSKRPFWRTKKKRAEAKPPL